MTELSDRAVFTLAVIGARPSLVGREKLQKAILLASKSIPDSDHYNWEASLAGAYSAEVVADVVNLKDDQLISITKEDKSDKILYKEEDVIFTHKITDKGKKHLKGFEKNDKIKILMDFYAARDYDDLLVDVCTVYPEYATNNNMKNLLHRVLKRRETYYKVPLTNVTPTPALLDKVCTNDIREELCAELGIEVPEPDPNAIDRLAGLWGKYFDERELDAAEEVRNVR